MSTVAGFELYWNCFKKYALQISLFLLPISCLSRDSLLTLCQIQHNHMCIVGSHEYMKLLYIESDYWSFTVRLEAARQGLKRRFFTSPTAIFFNWRSRSLIEPGAFCMSSRGATTEPHPLLKGYFWLFFAGL